MCIGAKGLGESNVLLERTSHLISLCLDTPVEWVGDTILNNMNLTTNLNHHLVLPELNMHLNSTTDITATYEPEILAGAMDIVVQRSTVPVIFRIYYSGKVVVLKCVSRAALDDAWESLSPHLVQTQPDQQLFDTAITNELHDESEEELDPQEIWDAFDEMLAELEM